MKSLRQRLREGVVTVGSWLSLSDVHLCEMMANGPFEWLVVDMEHTTTGPERMGNLIQVVSLAGVDALVRVGKNDDLLIKQALDAGATGIIVPMVNSAEDMAAAVAAARYPPSGRRGFGLHRAHGYGDDFDDYVVRIASETVVVGQIEHVDAVENLTEILSVPGVDAFMVGPYDLSGSVGVPGQWDDPGVIEALKVVEKHLKGPVPGGYHIVWPDAAELRGKIADGYRMIAYGSDMIFAGNAIKAAGTDIAQIRHDS